MKPRFFLFLPFLLAGCAGQPLQPHSVPQSSPAPVSALSSTFTGLSPARLQDRLGRPAFTRKDGPTEMWRYDAAVCHAYFFFQGGAVRHVETIPEGPGNSADPACLKTLTVS